VANVADNEAQVEEAAETSPQRSAYARQGMRSNLLLVALFLAAGAGVYVMAVKKGPAQASAQQQAAEQEVDMAILHLQRGTTAPSESQDTRQLIQNFHRELAQRQIPLERLRKNPFAFVPPAPPPAGAIAQAEDPAVRAAVVNERESHDRAMTALKGFQLQSIIMGRSGGIAVISNNLLTMGQKIEGFVVKSIEPKRVVLSFQGKDYSLYMQ
jgi:hypothetical protein